MIKVIFYFFYFLNLKSCPVLSELSLVHNRDVIFLLAGVWTWQNPHFTLSHFHNTVAPGRVHFQYGRPNLGYMFATQNHLGDIKCYWLIHGFEVCTDNYVPKMINNFLPNIWSTLQLLTIF